MISSFTRVVLLVIVASVATLELTGCGPIQRQRHFKRSIVYFSSTPIAQHRPEDGGRASWYLISHPDTSIPYLLKRINSEDLGEAGTAIILLQALGGQKFQTELLVAINKRDWSKSSGNISDYITISRTFLENNEKGRMEK